MPGELPARAVELVGDREAAPIPGPQEGHEVRFALDDLERRSFAATAMEMRFISGRPLKGGLPDVGVSSAHTPVGAATVWMRLRHPLLPGELASPLARVAATADFGNGVAAVLPFEEYLFINADLSIELDRRPAGEWIALEARTLLHPGRDRLGRERPARRARPARRRPPGARRPAALKPLILRPLRAALCA